MNISELVIYRNLKHEDLFEDMAGLMGLGRKQTRLPVQENWWNWQ